MTGGRCWTYWLQNALEHQFTVAQMRGYGHPVGRVTTWGQQEGVREGGRQECLVRNKGERMKTATHEAGYWLLQKAKAAPTTANTCQGQHSVLLRITVRKS
jgi:hypothetical protein